MPTIGVLALQGAFREHVRALEAAGAETRLVRLAAELEGLDGLVIPGGESTTMSILLDRMGLWEPLREALEQGLPTLATCAGMILLARQIDGGAGGQRGYGMLDIAVLRNGYGRQVDSFEAPVDVRGVGEFPGVFIRAPLIEDVGSAEVYASHDGKPVGVRQGRLTALCFHPELSGDPRLHREFVESLAPAAAP
ncbi:MAG TPA: pyridoxal 5'-phosphate synthase glutaminase subunit PdxT [Candidatus Dormibacteraeota bacterium]